MAPPRQDSIKTLATIAQILQKSLPSENPLAHIVMMVREQMQVDVCSLYLLQDKSLVLVATDGLDPSSVGKVRMGVHEGLTGLAIEKMQPVIVYEASKHPRFKYFPQTGEERFATFAAVPLLDREKVVGALTIQTVVSRQFEAREIEVLTLIAFQLAGVIQNLVTLEVLRAESDQKRHASQLRGLAVAPGFGIGSAFFVHPGVSPVILPAGQQEVGSPSEEWKKLKAAIQRASMDLLRLEKRLQRKFSKRESDIFYSHRMILSDKSFLKKLKGSVEKKTGAVEAVRMVIGHYIEEFGKIEDPHFRERAADLEDIRQRVLDHLVGRQKSRKQGKQQGILIAETLVPSDTAHMDPEKIQGIVTEKGGVTSHAAIIARSLGIPAVMGIPNLSSRIRPGDCIIVDGNIGTVYVNPEPRILQEYERIQEKFADKIVHLQNLSDQPAVTRDGKRIVLEANVGLFSGLKRLRQVGAEGIGLYRTEFPFMASRKLLDEEEQFSLYKKILEEVKGLPVTFRILDAGGDKPLEPLSLQKEANPYLGYRSIRITLSHPDIMRVQLRALLRASALGPIRILIPMVSGREEIRAVRKIFDEIRDDLSRRGTRFAEKIPIGLMIEVPSAVWLAHHLIEDCDFFSIGTNDLIQYTLAVDRNNERVAQFFEPLHPAVLASLAQVSRVGSEAGKTVSVCGEIAGDPFLTPVLVGLGITSLSMIPSSIPAVKSVILQSDYSKARRMTDEILKAATVEEVRALVAPFRKEIEEML